MKIAIQKGLEHLNETLKSKGYDTVPYRESGMDCNIAIINNIDESYEEMEPITYYDESTMVLNASRLTEEQVLKQIEIFSHGH